MSTNLIVSLNELHCIRESDLSGSSEPYIWPVLLWIDNDTITRPELMGVSAPTNDPNQGLWRVIIKSDMRAGETAAIPSSVGRLSALVADLPINQRFRIVVVVVLLFEKDNSPSEAMRAGYLVFPKELRNEVVKNFIDLKKAKDENNTTAFDALTKEIRERVGKAVSAAIQDNIGLVDIILGTFNLDDKIGTSFFFQDIVNINPDVDPPIAVTLEIVEENDEYVIRGELQLRNVPIDPCKTQADAVNVAQSSVDSINARIESLQEQLQNASPVEKPRIIKKIGIEERKLEIAINKLEVAQDALQTCRNQ